jgi:hypothetical protein
MASVTATPAAVVDSSKAGDAGLEWIQIQRDIAAQRGYVLDANPNVESAGDRFRRKFTENPLVPLGCAATGLVLSFGLVSFYRRNTKMSQTMMRARIAAQGFTVFALVLGVFKAASGGSTDQK